MHLTFSHVARGKNRRSTIFCNFKSCMEVDLWRKIHRTWLTVTHTSDRLSADLPQKLEPLESSHDCLAWSSDHQPSRHFESAGSHSPYNPSKVSSLDIAVEDFLFFFSFFVVRQARSYKAVQEETFSSMTMTPKEEDRPSHTDRSVYRSSKRTRSGAPMIRPSEYTIT